MASPHEISGYLSNAFFMIEDIRSVLECGCVTLRAELVIPPNEPEHLLMDR